MEIKTHSQLKIISLIMILAGLIQIGWSMDSRHFDPSERVNLNFRKTPVKNALILIARGSGKKTEITEDVQGTLTLSLENIAWYKAMDAVLKVCRLKKIETADQILITPIEDEKPSSSGDNFSNLRDKALSLSRRESPIPSTYQSAFETEMDGVKVPAITRKINTIPDKKITDPSQEGMPKIEISGISGTKNKRVAIAKVNGTNRLLKNGNILDGFYEIKSVESNGIEIIDTRNKETSFISF